MVVFHVQDGLEIEPELVAIEAQRRFQVADDNRDVVDPANTDAFGEGGLELIHGSPATSKRLRDRTGVR